MASIEGLDATSLLSTSEIIAGVDEVGRGPLAGPVVAAAVILHRDQEIVGLADSKKLSSAKRAVLAEQIKQQALSWYIAEASVEEIDQLNILHATMLAMKRAIESLKPVPTLALIDGNRCPETKIACQAIVKGDGLVAQISAASIIAKEYRDDLMKSLAQRYPQYGFEKNAGYPTQAHRQALKEFGVTPIHRKHFRPVAEVIAES